MKMVFMGFRHGHIMALYKHAQENGVRIAGACEEDPATRSSLAAAGDVRITHDSYAAMLDEVECDAVAVGDYYGKRGAIIIEALKRGKHVISDKPVCTRLEELDEIEELVRTKGLKIGCQLDMRNAGHMIKMRELVLGGVLGSIHAITVSGQHPLMWGTRPGWYFEEGKHGGTINDIAIHAFDFIPWITGLKFTGIAGARCWNAMAAKVCPGFNDGAQFMLTMDNGCGVMGDVSYFAPDSLGYSLAQYWRLTLYGDRGVAETSINMEEICLALNDSKAVARVAPAPGIAAGYLQSFMREVDGETEDLSPSTSDVLAASRTSLRVQAAADSSATMPL